MKNLFTFFAAFSMLLLTCVANAQNSDTTKTGGWFSHDMHDIAGTAQIQGTYRYTSMGPLNRMLAAGHLPYFTSNNNIWLNLSMNHIHNQLIVEDGIGFTPWTTANGNGIKTRFNQYQAFLKFGYNVSHNTDLRLFPFAGVNVSAQVLNIEDDAHVKSTTSFSDELTTSSISKTFYQPNFGIELGGGMDYLIKVKGKTMDCITVDRSIPIGIRAGYYINAARGQWRVDNNYRLDNGPDKNQSAFFVSVNIGLGYEVKK
ncbi:MAG TPA: hypothetical protein VHB54_02165 [Mucilaginibacter sp.]|nr:hypothetical protein [Mucilaginibacter sp.]